MNDAKILLSGVKPTGRPHIGNYFGAMKQFVDLQNDYECFFMIADYHALNFVQNGKEMRELIIDLALDFLAIGIDPKKSTIFQQSAISEHTELAWIFETITTVPYLERAHAFKDAESRGKEVSVGTFNYPMLMATDILLYDPDVVPVGQDQKQHIEITRDTAEKFNRIYGETFKLPEALIMDAVKVVPGTDGQKMSKSYKNTIGLFATDEEIVDAVMKIPTDSRGVDEPKDAETDNVFAMHKLFTEGPEFGELRDRYEAGGIGYKESKDILAKNIIKFVSPLREKRDSLKKDIPAVIEILKKGADHAKSRASEKMVDVREKIGVTLRQ